MISRVSRLGNTNRRIDLTGKRFGRLLVISPDQVVNRFLSWLCVCDCGNKKSIIGQHLRNGTTVSCGCFHRERVGDQHRVHGGCRWPEYRVWKVMRQRCNLKTSISYPMYGGRGIRVCKRWNKFENFIADMGRRPGPKYSIDRINTNGNYEPSNCRWATDIQQARNRTDSVRVKINGEVRHIREWAESAGLEAGTVISRYRRGIRGADLLGPLKKIFRNKRLTT